MAPAMHTEMWEHPATQANVATLRARGVIVLDPAVGPPHRRRLRPGPAARARRRSPQACRAVLAGRAVAGPRRAARVVVSAGGTREPLDPVRFLGNRSSGKQGYALAARRCRARRRGRARRGQRRRCPTRPAPPSCASARAEELRRAVLGRAPERRRRRDGRRRRRLPAGARRRRTRSRRTTPAESRRRRARAHRRRARRGRGRRARRTADARSWSASPPRPVTSAGDVLDHGRAKLARKGCDLLVVNDVADGRAFEADDNEVVVLGADGIAHRGARQAPKDAVGRSAVWDAVVADCLHAPELARARSRPLRARPVSPQRVASGSLRHAACRVGSAGDRSVRGRPVHEEHRPWPAACSPPSPSPRGTRTRSPTRSATRSSTRCSRRTRAAASRSRR